MSMTIKHFREYRALKKEVERVTRQLARLKENNNKRVADKVKGSSSNFPYGEAHIKLTGKTDNTPSIKRRESELAVLRAELLKLGAELKGFIKTVKDREVRDILAFYYLDGCRVCELAALLGQEGDGSTQIKKAHRYFEKVSMISKNG